MKRITLIALVSLGLTLPPVPVQHRHYRAVKAPSQGDGARALRQPRLAHVPNVLLTWKFDGDFSDIVFNVRAMRTNGVARPLFSWPIVATVTTNVCLLAVDTDAPAVWIGVSASNTMTGLESEFAP